MVPPFPKISLASVCRKRCGCARSTFARLNTAARVRSAPFTRLRRLAVPLEKYNLVFCAAALGCGQAIERRQRIGWQLDPEQASILNRSLDQIAALDVVGRECHYIRHPKSGVAHQQNHRARPEPLVRPAAYLITRRDDANDFVGRKRFNIVRFKQPRALQLPRRVLRRPFPIDAEIEELTKDIDFLDPCPIGLISPESVPVETLNAHFVDVLHVDGSAMFRQKLRMRVYFRRVSDARSACCA